MIPVFYDESDLPVLAQMLGWAEKYRAQQGYPLTSAQERLRDQSSALATALLATVRQAAASYDARITPAEAAKRWGITEQGVRDLCRRGRLRHQRDGRRIWLDPADVAAYVPRSAR